MWINYTVYYIDKLSAIDITISVSHIVQKSQAILYYYHENENLIINCITKRLFLWFPIRITILFIFQNKISTYINKEVNEKKIYKRVETILGVFE